MLILAMLVLLAGCAAAPAAPAVQCRIVLESSPAFTAQTQTAAVTPGQTVTFTLTPADGYTLTGADYPGARLTRTDTGYTLSLPEVRYSTAVAVTAEKSDTVLYYRDNLGGDWIEAPVTASHLRVNTAIQGELFNNPGHTLTGWNTAPDGSGQAVGLGSRTAPGSRLYAQWAAQNDAAEFTFTVNNGTATVTDWQGSGERLVLPDTLDGAPVVEIAAGAFTNAACREVILPDTLRRIEPEAFTGCAVETLTLFDNLPLQAARRCAPCTSTPRPPPSTAAATTPPLPTSTTGCCRFPKRASSCCSPAPRRGLATTARHWIKPCPAMRWSTWGFLPIPTHCPSWN